MKVWDRAGMEIATPGSAVGLATNCATGPGEPAGQLKNRTPGQAPLQECILNRLAKPRDSTSILKALHGKFDIKRHSPCILYLAIST